MDAPAGVIGEGPRRARSSGAPAEIIVCSVAGHGQPSRTSATSRSNMNGTPAKEPCADAHRVVEDLRRHEGVAQHDRRALQQQRRDDVAERVRVRHRDRADLPVVGPDAHDLAEGAPVGRDLGLGRDGRLRPPVDPDVSFSMATGPVATAIGRDGSARRASRRPAGRACSPAPSRPSGTTSADTSNRAATAAASAQGAAIDRQQRRPDVEAREQQREIAGAVADVRGERVPGPDAELTERGRRRAGVGAELGRGHHAALGGRVDQRSVGRVRARRRAASTSTGISAQAPRTVAASSSMAGAAAGR